MWVSVGVIFVVSVRVIVGEMVTVEFRFEVFVGVSFGADLFLLL